METKKPHAHGPRASTIGGMPSFFAFMRGVGALAPRHALPPNTRPRSRDRQHAIKAAALARAKAAKGRKRD